MTPSRILYVSPNGPQCFVDFGSVSEGKAVMDLIRQNIAAPPLPKLYELRLFEILKDKLVRIDELVLPKFDSFYMSLFLNGRAALQQ